MVQILIFILKWIGWIVLGFLGLILGILLLVLFSAIRYRIDGKKEDSLWGKFYLSWFFRIISVAVTYENGLSVQAKLFGKTIYKLDGRESEAGGEEKLPGEGQAREAPQGEDFFDNLLPTEYEISGEEKLDKKKTDKEKIDKKKKDKTKSDKEKILLDELQALEQERERKLSGETKTVKPAADEEEKKGLWEKLKEKIAAWIDKVTFAFSEICGKLKQIEEKRQWLTTQWEWLSAMLSDQENQKSARLILRQVKKILCHILPRKGTVLLVLGREDPYLMGKIVSYASAAYPFTHRFLTFYPIFGQDRLEGEVHIRGHVRLGVIFGYALRLLLNKNIRRKLLCVLRRNKRR